jgi:hypothetical protein
LIECKTYWHARYKPRTRKEMTLVAHKNWDTSRSLIDCKDYSCL